MIAALSSGPVFEGNADEYKLLPFLAPCWRFIPRR